MPSITVQSVRQYYEQNTPLFSYFGNTNKARSIHRALWLPGIQDLEEALAASNRLILQEIQDLILESPPGPLRLADLGCGIGRSLFYLLKRIPTTAFATGITINPSQACLAQVQASKEADLHTIGFTVADFQATPLPAKAFGLAFSIEAFAHASHPARYLAETARLLLDIKR